MEMEDHTDDGVVGSEDGRRSADERDSSARWRGRIANEERREHRERSD